MTGRALPSQDPGGTTASLVLHIRRVLGIMLEAYTAPEASSSRAPGISRAMGSGRPSKGEVWGRM
jgi:hypothetical protein